MGGDDNNRTQETDLKIGLISSIYSPDIRLFNFKKENLARVFQGWSTASTDHLHCSLEKKEKKKGEHQAEFFLMFLEQPEH